MSTPIMATKLYMPAPRPNAVLRRRLTDRLNNGLYRKFTLISAPAGYGKTTLVGEWLADCGRPAAWLSLEEGDGELARFLTCMISSLRTIGENIGEGVLAVLQAPQPAPAEAILTALLNEIAVLPAPFILVLDDYHAAASRSVDEALSFLLDHLPGRMHLVMTTREDPNIPLARLRARDQLTELRTADLRFTGSECERFLTRSMGLRMSMDKIASLETHTEGWIAGLHLAALSLQGNEDVDRLLPSFTGSHAFVLDYLVEEVLQRQPVAVQSFLLRTSILDRLCGSLCDEVMGDPAASGKDTLMALDRKNLFVVPLDHERRWYRYHRLFADLLRRRLQDSHDERRIAELHRRASVWHEARGFEIEAFGHAVESRDIDRAARLLEGNGMPLHLRGAAGIALRWLSTLPAAALNARPALWVYYGSALLMAGKPTGVEHKLRAAEAILADAEESVGVRDLAGLIAATRATLASLTLTDRPEDADRRLQAAEAAMQDAGLEDKTDELVGLIAPAGDARIGGDPGIENVIVQSRLALTYLRPELLPVRTAAAWMLGVACQRRGDYAAARDAYSEVISNSRTMGHQLMAVIAMIGLGQIEEAEDRTASAAAYYEEALRLGGDLPLPALREARLGLERAQGRAARSQLVEPLSPRELEVLELIARGLSNREIGERLFLALDTVKGHNRRIFEKLQVQRRTEAIARAGELNLFPDNARKPH
ncbi:helix-turn-helix transcriptional regulator [Cohnella sp. JJ-181]|uniref:helix-turn-helix transcriptional regulator n=1 Tax=Cohnella rhizoplanae TaxID=2974897 RepID=UPI0022FFB696|nr:LuxR C-terminal-related transcriptional regulator [Cohnella sp. JJ-181]CAI6060740.1 HTH-type transcriptional regulator MalT [Cohnella sp. JJ-181]